MVKKDKKNQPNKTSPFRDPKAKKRLGLKVPDIRMPHLELVQAEFQEHLDKSDSGNSPSSGTEKTTLPSQTRQSSQTRQAEQFVKKDVSPKKDFQKIPNSITRNAIPEGFFKAGKSKQLYDVLYSLTRGAIAPTHSIRISKNKLMKKAGIGSRITFDSIITNFESIGLIEIKIYAGQHQGNEFKVFTYEEIETSYPAETSLPSVSSQPSVTRYAQKLDRLLTLETRQTRQSLNDENTDTYNTPKTLLKTLNNDDDETAAFADFIKEISEASIRITGKKLKKAESKKWREVAELLVMELELAAARTEAVSSVPAFLKEVLRRKLETKSSVVKKVDSKVSQSLKVGKSSESKAEETFETWEKEPLGKEEKEKTVQIMRDRIEEGHRDLVMSMKQTYTEEDWEWLMEKIEKR